MEEQEQKINKNIELLKSEITGKKPETTDGKNEQSEQYSVGSDILLKEAKQYDRLNDPYNQNTF